MHTGAEQRAAGDGALGQARLEAKPRPASAKPFNRPAPRLASFRRPTLQALPKTIPVVASASGAAVARSCGFRTVYTLCPGQSLTLLGGRMTVQGTEGALVGPPWSQRELGVVLRENLGAGGAARPGRLPVLRAARRLHPRVCVARRARGRRGVSALLPNPAGLPAGEAWGWGGSSAQPGVLAGSGPSPDVERGAGPGPSRPAARRCRAGRA